MSATEVMAELEKLPAAEREAIVPRKSAALPVLRALAQATNETAHLSIIEGDKLGMLAFAYASAHATRNRPSNS